MVYVLLPCHKVDLSPAIRLLAWIVLKELI